jgi:hypothetical protein
MWSSCAQQEMVAGAVIIPALLIVRAHRAGGSAAAPFIYTLF